MCSSLFREFYGSFFISWGQASISCPCLGDVCAVAICGASFNSGVKLCCVCVKKVWWCETDGNSFTVLEISLHSSFDVVEYWATYERLSHMKRIS